MDFYFFDWNASLLESTFPLLLYTSAKWVSNHNIFEAAYSVISLFDFL